MRSPASLPAAAGLVGRASAGWRASCDMQVARVGEGLQRGAPDADARVAEPGVDLWQQERQPTSSG